jgi:aminoglycoside phosphotransferase (APT) family kinase protein
VIGVHNEQLLKHDRGSENINFISFLIISQSALGTFIFSRGAFSYTELHRNSTSTSNITMASKDQPSKPKASADKAPTAKEPSSEHEGQEGLDIPDEQLVALARRIATDHLGMSTSGGEIPDVWLGCSNVVFIVKLDRPDNDTPFNIAIRVPKMDKGVALRPNAAKSMKSQATTLRHILDKTKIPVPEIYHLDVTADNEISMPYMAMRFLGGKPLYKFWAGEGLTPSAREQLRLKCLSSLAHVMAQFSSMSFDTYGSLAENEPGSAFVGPLYEMDPCANCPVCLEKNGIPDLQTRGPHASAFCELNSDYKQSLGRFVDPQNPREKGIFRIMEVLLRCLGKLDASVKGYVLCPPYLDRQNILVGDDGTITGLVDWDEVETAPRWHGYARFPLFLARDWEPYGQIDWDEPKHARFDKDSARLETYRAYYNMEMARALDGKGDSALTQRSHIVNAIWVAGVNVMSRTNICIKFMLAANLVPAAADCKDDPEPKTEDGDGDSDDEGSVSSQDTENSYGSRYLETDEDEAQGVDVLEGLETIGRYTEEEFAAMEAKLEKYVLG